MQVHGEKGRREEGGGKGKEIGGDELTDPHSVVTEEDVVQYTAIVWPSGGHLDHSLRDEPTKCIWRGESGGTKFLSPPPQ